MSAMKPPKAVLPILRNRRNSAPGDIGAGA
jgi:hypothetical protein